MLTRAALAVVVAVLVWPNEAGAQIYAWRDASGNLVLSDRRLDGSATDAVFAPHLEAESLQSDPDPGNVDVVWLQERTTGLK